MTIIMKLEYHIIIYLTDAQSDNIKDVVVVVRAGRVILSRRISGVGHFALLWRMSWNTDAFNGGKLQKFIIKENEDEDE